MNVLQIFQKNRHLCFQKLYKKSSKPYYQTSLIKFSWRSAWVLTESFIQAGLPDHTYTLGLKITPAISLISGKTWSLKLPIKTFENSLVSIQVWLYELFKCGYPRGRACNMKNNNRVTERGVLSRHMQRWEFIKENTKYFTFFLGCFLDWERVFFLFFLTVFFVESVFSCFFNF